MRDNIYNPAPGAYSSALQAYLPFSVQIQPGPTSSGTSTAYGPSLQGGLLNLQHNFTVVARDQFGNRRLQGGDLFNVIIYGPGSFGTLAGVQLLDAGDGTYSVRISLSPVLGMSPFTS